MVFDNKVNLVDKVTYDNFFSINDYVFEVLVDSDYFVHFCWCNFNDSWQLEPSIETPITIEPWRTDTKSLSILSRQIFYFNLGKVFANVHFVRKKNTKTILSHLYFVSFFDNTHLKFNKV